MRCPGALRCGGPRWGAQRPVKVGWNTCPGKRQRLEHVPLEEDSAILPTTCAPLEPIYRTHKRQSQQTLQGPATPRSSGQAFGTKRDRIVNSPSPGTGQQLERSVPIIFLPFPGNTASHSLLRAGAWQWICREPRIRAEGRPVSQGSPRSAEAGRVQSTSTFSYPVIY